VRQPTISMFQSCVCNQTMTRTNPHKFVNFYICRLERVQTSICLSYPTTQTNGPLLKVISMDVLENVCDRSFGEISNGTK